MAIVSPPGSWAERSQRPNLDLDQPLLIGSRSDWALAEAGINRALTGGPKNGGMRLVGADHRGCLDVESAHGGTVPPTVHCTSARTGSAATRCGRNTGDIKHSSHGRP